MRLIYFNEIKQGYKPPNTQVVFYGPLFLASDPKGPKYAATKGSIDKSFQDLKAEDILEGKIQETTFPAFMGDIRNPKGKNDFKLLKLGKKMRIGNPVFDEQGRVISGNEKLIIPAGAIGDISFSKITFDSYKSKGHPDNKGMSYKDFVKSTAVTHLAVYDDNLIEKKIRIDKNIYDSTGVLNEEGLDTVLGKWRDPSLELIKTDSYDNIVRDTPDYGDGWNDEVPEIDTPELPGPRTAGGRAWHMQSDFTKETTSLTGTVPTLIGIDTEKSVLKKMDNMFVDQGKLKFLNTDGHQSLEYPLNSNGTIPADSFNKAGSMTFGKINEKMQGITPFVIVGRTFYSLKQAGRDVSIRMARYTNGTWRDAWMEPTVIGQGDVRQFTMLAVNGRVYILSLFTKDVHYFNVETDPNIVSIKKLPVEFNVPSTTELTYGITAFVQNDEIHLIPGYQKHYADNKIALVTKPNNTEYYKLKLFGNEPDAPWEKVKVTTPFVDAERTCLVFKSKVYLISGIFTSENKRIHPIDIDEFDGKGMKKIVEGLKHKMEVKQPFQPELNEGYWKKDPRNKPGYWKPNPNYVPGTTKPNPNYKPGYYKPNPNNKPARWSGNPAKLDSNGIDSTNKYVDINKLSPMVAALFHRVPQANKGASSSGATDYVSGSSIDSNFIYPSTFSHWIPGTGNPAWPGYSVSRKAGKGTPKQVGDLGHMSTVNVASIANSTPVWSSMGASGYVFRIQINGGIYTIIGGACNINRYKEARSWTGGGGDTYTDWACVQTRQEIWKAYDPNDKGVWLPEEKYPDVWVPPVGQPTINVPPVGEPNIWVPAEEYPDIWVTPEEASGYWKPDPRNRPGYWEIDPGYPSTAKVPNPNYIPGYFAPNPDNKPGYWKLDPNGSSDMIDISLLKLDVDTWFFDATGSPDYDFLFITCRFKGGQQAKGNYWSTWPGGSPSSPNYNVHHGSSQYAKPDKEWETLVNVYSDIPKGKDGVMWLVFELGDPEKYMVAKYEAKNLTSVKKTIDGKDDPNGVLVSLGKVLGTYSAWKPGHGGTGREWTNLNGTTDVSAQWSFGGGDYMYRFNSTQEQPGHYFDRDADVSWAETEWMVVDPQPWRNKTGEWKDLESVRKGANIDGTYYRLYFVFRTSQPGIFRVREHRANQLRFEYFAGGGDNYHRYGGDGTWTDGGYGNANNGGYIWVPEVKLDDVWIAPVGTEFITVPVTDTNRPGYIEYSKKVDVSQLVELPYPVLEKGHKANVRGHQALRRSGGTYQKYMVMWRFDIDHASKQEHYWYQGLGMGYMGTNKDSYLVFKKDLDVFNTSTPKPFPVFRALAFDDKGNPTKMERLMCRPALMRNPIEYTGLTSYNYTIEQTAQSSDFVNKPIDPNEGMRWVPEIKYDDIWVEGEGIPIQDDEPDPVISVAVANGRVYISSGYKLWTVPSSTTLQDYDKYLDPHYDREE